MRAPKSERSFAERCGQGMSIIWLRYLLLYGRGWPLTMSLTNDLSELTSFDTRIGRLDAVAERVFSVLEAKNQWFGPSALALETHFPRSVVVSSLIDLTKAGFVRLRAADGSVEATAVRHTR